MLSLLNASASNKTANLPLIPQSPFTKLKTGLYSLKTLLTNCPAHGNIHPLIQP
ncbi:hypothetical protein [Gynurincola endophyticus]|uniref:hypothetical protein n=1 Tax=Gynurincola endophyticus TaxID=2479004 RepID=UPI00131527A4|nr:hypothetical protein [Gynurincola endophyticus]